MNASPGIPGQCRIAREECEPGDWVDAAIAPEWSADLPSHVFRRPRVSISPGDGHMGGLLRDQPEEWIFVHARRGSGLVWVRES